MTTTNLQTIEALYKKYSHKDIFLLAKTDKLHNTPCGQSVKKICERAVTVFGDDKCKCLSVLSISRLYNLTMVIM